MPPPQSVVQEDSGRVPETDGGRALRMTISGDQVVRPGSTVTLTCRAHLTLRPQVPIPLNQDLNQHHLLSIFRALSLLSGEETVLNSVAEVRMMEKEC